MTEALLAQARTMWLKRTYTLTSEQKAMVNRRMAVVLESLSEPDIRRYDADADDERDPDRFRDDCRKLSVALDDEPELRPYVQCCLIKLGLSLRDIERSAWLTDPQPEQML